MVAEDTEDVDEIGMDPINLSKDVDIMSAINIDPEIITIETVTNIKITKINPVVIHLEVDVITTITYRQHRHPQTQISLLITTAMRHNPYLINIM